MKPDHYAAWQEGYQRGRDEWAWRQANGLPSKSEEIRAALLRDPDLQPARLAEDLGCSRGLVHFVKKRMERKANET